ncbi:hypothetical protein K501DRAFT_266141 [Backusella circina FSU 941]|nr:hypothetical protein K501DRAFT_266141 [Backusella circina FSU 941]
MSKKFKRIVLSATKSYISAVVDLHSEQSLSDPHSHRHYTHNKLVANFKQSLRYEKQKHKVKKESIPDLHLFSYCKTNEEGHFNYYATVREIAKVPVLNFIDNWDHLTTGIKGDTRRKLKPLLDRMKSIKHDSTLVIDEHSTTVTCSSFFGPTWKQKNYKNGQWREVKGAVVFYNDECLRRLYRNATTINRDQNGSYNIGLDGLSKILSEDHFPLPVFDRILYKSNSYKLFNINQAVEVPNKETDTQSQTIILERLKSSK